MGWTPSIVPATDDTVYLVVDDLHELGHVWREASFGQTDIDTVIEDILAAQYNSPFRIVAFNTEERWSRDVSADVAAEVRRRFDVADEDIPTYLAPFVERYTGASRQLSLRLA